MLSQPRPETKLVAPDPPNMKLMDAHVQTQISAFWNAQAQAYLQPGSAGWIIWSLKMEKGGIWSLESCYNGVRVESTGKMAVVRAPRAGLPARAASSARLLAMGSWPDCAGPLLRVQWHSKCSAHACVMKWLRITV